MQTSRGWLALALMTLVSLSAQTSWGDEGNIQTQSGRLDKPRRAKLLSKGPTAPEEAMVSQEHIEPRMSPRTVAAAAPMAATVTLNPPTNLLSDTAAGIEILENRPLSDAETGDRTGLVAEPTATARGKEILVTANTFAAFSRDGRNFQHDDPQAVFGPSRHGKFCCDQSVVYDKAHDLIIWLLQYLDDGRENSLRLAVAHGRDISRGAWRFYDLDPQTVGGWRDHYFDFSSITLGESFVYVTTNIAVTGQTEGFERGVVIRLPLAQLAKYKALSYDLFSVAGVVELRATEGATRTMYWGAHLFSKQEPTIRVYTWPEMSRTVHFLDTIVAPWSPVAQGNPDFDVWLGRIDSAMTAGWRTAGGLGFAWTAGTDANHPRPHVRVAILDEAGKLLAEPHLWNPNLSFAYPAAAPNSQGIVGITLQYSGQNLPPSQAVGLLSSAGSSQQWRLVSTKQGTDNPEKQRDNSTIWGDYLSIQPVAEDGWLATGFTLQGGQTNRDVEVLLIRFRPR